VINYFILDEHKNPIPCNFNEWCDYQHNVDIKHNKVIGSEKNKNFELNTIFFGISMDVDPSDKYNPFLFSTIIVDENTKEIYKVLSNSWIDAHIEHLKASDWLSTFFIKNEI